MIPVDVDVVLRALLMRDAAIAAIVGDNARPLGNFTGTGDCIVWALRAGETNKSLGGDEELQNPSVQLDLYASDFDRAKELKEAVYHRLSSVSYKLIAGHRVHSISLDQPRDDDEPLLVGETIPPTVFTLDVRLWLERYSDDPVIGGVILEAP